MKKLIVAALILCLSSSAFAFDPVTKHDPAVPKNEAVELAGIGLMAALYSPALVVPGVLLFAGSVCWDAGCFKSKPEAKAEAKPEAKPETYTKKGDEK